MMVAHLSQIQIAGFITLSQSTVFMNSVYLLKRVCQCLHDGRTVLTFLKTKYLEQCLNPFVGYSWLSWQ